MFLNDCSSWHCVVNDVEVFVDGFRSNFLTETLTVETSLDEESAYKALSASAKAFSRDVTIEK